MHNLLLRQFTHWKYRHKIPCMFFSCKDPPDHVSCCFIVVVFNLIKIFFSFLRGRRPPWKQVLPLLGLFFHLEFYFNHLPGQKNESETFEMICMNLLLIDELGAIFKSSNPKVLSYILVEKDIKRWPWNLDDNRTFNIITGAK